MVFDIRPISDVMPNSRGVISTLEPDEVPIAECEKSAYDARNRLGLALDLLEINAGFC